MFFFICGNRKQYDCGVVSTGAGKVEGGIVRLDNKT